MCPPIPFPLSAFGSSDEQIISSLDIYIRGSPLPDNVIADLDLYQYNPSNLPEGFWYLIHSNEKREAAFGFWKTKGETHEICLNSELSGRRTTLEFFEGEAPNGRRTGWLMQEYRISQKGLCHKTEPKDSKSLCRIFLSSVHSPKNEIQPSYKKTDVSAKCNSSTASVNRSNNITSAHDSSRKSEVKRVQNTFPDDFAECFSRGDFLELNDLAEPESLSSSSENSSCPSRASDENFDSLALLRDLNEGKDLSKYRFSASVRPDKVVMKPATSGSIESGNGSKHAVEGFLTGSAPNPNQRQESEHRIEGTTHLYDEAKPSATGERKAVVPIKKGKAVGGRMQRLKEIFCCF